MMLSIVIPTKKSRLDLAAKCAIESVLSIKSNEVELILHVDNDLNDKPWGMLSELSDSRLRYIEFPHAIPMTENWERAMAYVTGKYVMYLGDDDAVMPDIMHLVEWASDNEIDNILHTGKWIYYWPTFNAMKKTGILKLSMPSWEMEWVDVKKIALQNSFGAKMRNYRRQPEIYHGIIKKNVADQMFSRTGKYFGSVIPDLYFAFAVAPYVKRCCIVDFPYSLAGHSDKSNATRFAKNLMQEQERQFLQYQWLEVIPHFHDYVSYYIDAKYRAYLESGQNGLIRNIDIPEAFANCLLNKPRTIEKTNKVLLQYAKSMQLRGVKPLAGFFILFMKLFSILLVRANLKMPYPLHVWDRKNNYIFKTRPDLVVECDTISKAINAVQKIKAQQIGQIVSNLPFMRTNSIDH